MERKIILHHRTGAADEFPLEEPRTITFGRDPSCNVAFDPERDEITSRQHARLTAAPGDPPLVKLADLGPGGRRLLGPHLMGRARRRPPDFSRRLRG